MRPYQGLLFILLLSPVPLRAMGLAMKFTDVTLENVEPGARINLRVAKNLPLVVINQDPTEGADVVVESLLPNPRELKEGYEPIPDVTWIQTLPDHFHLGPKASASADVLINVPDDPKYVGHSYEVILWVRTDQKNRVLSEGGVLFAVGLRSRFRISVGTRGPASLQREKAMRKLATINTNFSLSPDNLFIHDVPIGVSVDLKADKKASLKVVNQSDDPVDVKVRPVDPDPNVQAQTGYSYAPDYHWLEISPTHVKVNPNSIKELKMRLKIPDDPQYRGQKYMFFVLTSLNDESLPLAYYNFVYVDTAR